jgi:hypothetical protein
MAPNVPFTGVVWGRSSMIRRDGSHGAASTLTARLSIGVSGPPHEGTS